jgi:hypothetical protein
MAKICDLRYFGLRKQEGFGKVRGDIAKMLRDRFWELEELDREDVYQVF